MTKEEASKAIAEKIKTAQELIGEAETIADEAGVDFNWSGPSWGMGGWYTGKDSEDWTESDRDEFGEGSEGGYWLTSSSRC
jgi:hypothetical protein